MKTPHVVIAVVSLAALVAFAAVRLGAGSGTETPDAPTSSRERRQASADRVPAADIEAGLARCGTRLESLSPTDAMSFTELMRECSGLFGRRSCRDALRAETFSRQDVAAACRAAYCEDLRPAPSFCTIELPTDADFLIQFGRFTRAALRRDLRRVMEAEGAAEIADLMGDLIEQQSQVELEVEDTGE